MSKRKAPAAPATDKGNCGENYFHRIKKMDGVGVRSSSIVHQRDVLLWWGFIIFLDGKKTTKEIEKVMIHAKNLTTNVHNAH